MTSYLNIWCFHSVKHVPALNRKVCKNLHYKSFYCRDDEEWPYSGRQRKLSTQIVWSQMCISGFISGLNVVYSQCSFGWGKIFSCGHQSGHFHLVLRWVSVTHLLRLWISLKQSLLISWSVMSDTTEWTNLCYVAFEWAGKEANERLRRPCFGVLSLNTSRIVQREYVKHIHVYIFEKCRGLRSKRTHSCSYWMFLKETQHTGDKHRWVKTRSDVWPSVVSYTQNVCSAFNSFKFTHTQ